MKAILAIFSSPSDQNSRWQWRDWLAAALLAAATALFVLWQNAHLTVLWDASYTLDTSARIALGQRPYRDFPLVHAPLTFLIQAAILRLSGRVYWHAVAWAAAAGASATVLAWRIVLESLRGRMRFAWTASFLLSAPLVFLGNYAILPFPSYDCDSILAVLLFLAAWLRGMQRHARPAPLLAGASLMLPALFKQNIGLPLALCSLILVALILLVERLQPAWLRSIEIERRELFLFAAGAIAASLVALATLAATVGLDNYIQWTIRFAAERRMPGLASMLEVYREPMLVWQLPAIGLGLCLLRFSTKQRAWTRWIALALLAAPLLWTLAGQALGDDMEDRATSLLALWPLLLALSIPMALVKFARSPGVRAALPIMALAAIHGAMLSQQLWGSTYALWPLAAILLAQLIAGVASVEKAEEKNTRAPIAALLAALCGMVLLISGGLYATSEERLTYADVHAEPLRQARWPALKGMAMGGDYLPEFEELLAFSEKEIPREDGLILLPGEEPFYFATGRAPRFPVLLFDHGTDPYSPAQLADEARRHQIRWLIVKQRLQSVQDPMPEREATMAELLRDFHFHRALRGYDIYRRD